MPFEVASAACKTAHELGLPVMAHVESTEGVRVALAAGVDTIEHGAPMTPEILDLYRGSAGTQLPGRLPSVTCTISPALPFVLLDPEKTHSTDVQKTNGDIVCAGIIDSAREAARRWASPWALARTRAARMSRSTTCGVRWPTLPSTLASRMRLPFTRPPR